MLLMVVAAASVAFGTPLFQDVPQDNGIVVTGEADKRNKRVCKRSVATGSIMAKSTCKTAGEWEVEKIRNDIAADKMRYEQRMAEAARLEKMLAGH